MEQTYRNYKRLLELAEKDPEYCFLERKFQAMANEIEDLFLRLTEQDRDCIAEYLGLHSEMNVRMVEIACVSMTFRD